MPTKPILFSTPMVQALLAGRKTMTRRTKGLESFNDNPDEWDFSAIGTHPDSDEDSEKIYAYFHIKDSETWVYNKLPYAVGDILWVRETFTILEPEHCEGMSKRFFYKADQVEEEWRLDCIADGYSYKWKPSLFMPREAARIFLKVTDIKIERVQSISEEDAIAEGFEQHRPDIDWLSARFEFKAIWRTINGLDSWDINPWVIAYKFERVEKPEGF